MSAADPLAEVERRIEALRNEEWQEHLRLHPLANGRSDPRCYGVHDALASAGNVVRDVMREVRAATTETPPTPHTHGGTDAPECTTCTSPTGDSDREARDAHTGLTDREEAAMILRRPATGDTLTDTEREAIWQAARDYWRLMPWWPADSETEEGEREVFLGGEGGRVIAAVERILADRRTGVDVAILNAIKVVREAAADERAALHDQGEPLTDYGSGVLDGLDKAWLAGRKAASRPEDTRTTTSIEEWWACDDAYEKGPADRRNGEAERVKPKCGCTAQGGGVYDDECPLHAGTQDRIFMEQLLDAARAREADLRARIEALADEPEAPYPADCNCAHGVGFQWHHYPCRFADLIPKAALRAALATDPEATVSRGETGWTQCSDESCPNYRYGPKRVHAHPTDDGSKQSAPVLDLPAGKDGDLG